MAFLATTFAVPACTALALGGDIPAFAGLALDAPASAGLDALATLDAYHTLDGLAWVVHDASAGLASAEADPDAVVALSPDDIY